jgi:very-short-patch-repair endonuclease
MDLPLAVRIPVLYARQLRAEMTPAERIMWKKLRNRRFAEAKFRRQQPIDWYIADFFCAEARLVLELDGESHMGKEERDANRQVYIESHGLRVMRFWNFEVYEELPWVLDCIGFALDQALPPLGEPSARRNRKPR